LNSKQTLTNTKERKKEQNQKKNKEVTKTSKKQDAKPKIIIINSNKKQRKIKRELRDHNDFKESHKGQKIERRNKEIRSKTKEGRKEE